MIELAVLRDYMTDIPTITLQLTLPTLPKIMRRERHVLILIRTWDGNFILGSKGPYPANIHRMVGGGLDSNEDPQAGAARELAEELHLDAVQKDVIPLAQVIAKINHQAEDLTFSTWLFFYQLAASQTLQPDDDLNGIVELTPIEFQALINRFSQLQDNFNHEHNFSWGDYGKLYGPMHQIALDRANQLLTQS